MAHAEENMDNVTQGAIVGIDGTGAGDITKSGELWRAAGMDGKSSPLLVDGRLYACDDGGKMFVLDAASGKEICKPAKLIGTIVRSSPVYGDGKIYICTTSAWHIFKPTADGVKLIHKLRLAEDDEVSGSPAISHGRIYLPTGGHMYCIGSKDQKPSADPIPAPPAETPAADDDQAGSRASDAIRRATEARRNTAIHRAAVQRPRTIVARTALARFSRWMVRARSTYKANTPTLRPASRSTRPPSLPPRSAS